MGCVGRTICGAHMFSSHRMHPKAVETTPVRGSTNSPLNTSTRSDRKTSSLTSSNKCKDQAPKYALQAHSLTPAESIISVFSFTRKRREAVSVPRHAWISCKQTRDRMLLPSGVFCIHAYERRLRAYNHWHVLRSFSDILVRNPDHKACLRWLCV